MRVVRLTLLLSMPVLLANCASIIEGTTQTISIDTSPQGARCELAREGQVIGAIDPTPGGILVEKTKHDINVTCTKTGYEEARTLLKSEVEVTTLGNIILGGGIGWAIDSAAGADNKYQEHISVTLPPLGAGDAAKTANERPARSDFGDSIWRTVGQGVSAYADARGTGGSVVMPPTVDLTLVERNDDWGRFRYANSDGTSGDAWIHMNLVRRL